MNWTDLNFPHKKALGANNTQGFTLIEMLVVLGIIVMISFMAMPSVNSYFQLSINSATRDLASVIKEAYNSAVVTGKVCRLAYDFKKNEYWVESGPANTLLDTKESKEKEEMRKKFAKDSDSPATSEFKLDVTVTRKKKGLPRGVEFEDVLTQQFPTPVSEGTAFTHFFPLGITEKTIIHLKDSNKHHASLVITPLLGMTDVYDRYIDKKEIFTK